MTLDPTHPEAIAAEAEVPPRRLRVLVAEDGRVSRLWLIRTLQKLGHETIEAEDGTRAWELFKERAPDVVITDWMMPGFNGSELCRRIRTDASSAYVYVIFTTVLEDRQHIFDGLTAGADDYLVKPIFADDIEARLIVADRVTALHRAGAETLTHRDMLLQLARRFATETDPERLLSDALTTAAHLLRADAAVVYRWDETSRALFAVRSTVWEDARRLRVELGHGAAGRACLLGDPVVIDHYHAEDPASTLLVEAGIHVALAAPLMHEGRLLGAVEVGSRQADRRFSVADGDTLELLATSVANAFVSLENATVLRTLAMTDPLTGLANQPTAADVLKRYLKLAQRKARTLALVVLNVDRLAEINVAHGRRAGDAVLQHLGGLLTRTFRGEDVLARWTGDLFVVGMFDMQPDVAVARLTTLQRQFGEQRFASPSGKLFGATFSAGVVRFPEDGVSLADLISAATTSLDAAKRGGRDAIAVASRDVSSAPAAV